MKKGCELCNLPARMYCESDKARLCWECNKKIHSANFLVAKHSRSLICNLCQCPTPWTAAGPKLPPTTVSVCHSCLLNNNNNAPNSSKELSSDGNRNTSREGDTDDVAADTEEDDDDENSKGGGGEEEDGENQVVTLHSTSNINVEEEVSSSSRSRFSAGSVST